MTPEELKELNAWRKAAQSHDAAEVKEAPVIPVVPKPTRISMSRVLERKIRHALMLPLPEQDRQRIVASTIAKHLICQELGQDKYAVIIHRAASAAKEIISNISTEQAQ